MALSEARVPVEDRGYQFGDGVYEVIQTYQGRIFSLDAHLSRLEKSARAIGLTLHYSRKKWKQIIAEAHKRSRLREARIYVQVTRGVAARTHEVPKGVRPTTLVTVRRYAPIPAPLRKRGVSVITMEDLRWGRCDIKSINLLPNILAKQKAKSRGTFEAIFVRNGWITEGSSSNLFAVIQESLVTPPAGPHLLSGITRDFVLGLGRRAGLDVKERDVSLDEIYDADELFLSGTSVEVLAVTRVNGHAIASGRPGVCTERLYVLFKKLTQSRSR